MPLSSTFAPIAPVRGRPRPVASALAVAAAVLLLAAAPARAQDAAPPTTPSAAAPVAPAPATSPTTTQGAPATPVQTAPQTMPRFVGPDPASTSPAATSPLPAAEPAPAPSLAPAAPASTAAPQTEGAPSPIPPPSFEAPGAAPAPTESAAAEASLPHDLSPWGMFMAADYVVKGVMIGLAFASLVTWTIWLAKAMELWSARTKATRALRCLERSPTLAEAVTARKGSRWPKRGPVAALAGAAALEISRSDGLEADGVKERAAVALQRIEARAGRTMSRGTGLLATIGSTAPFVGLFGTVWGIMNAFIGISRSNTTNLAVVAPGIAEALLATAIGLVAAIPAVIIYNVFARSIAGYRAVLGDASAEILRHLSRDLDRRAQGPARVPEALQAAE